VHSRPRGATLCGVSNRESVRVSLELRPAQNTIAGELAVEDAAATDFYGWLELIELLEHAAQTSDAGNGSAIDIATPDGGT
jgi:hypothetical protein